MKQHKKGFILAAVALLVIGALAFVGYNLYRYPDRFRRLSDESLEQAQTEALKEEILSRADTKILIAYFSYSGMTKGVAEAIREKTGGDLFEIATQDGYSNVYTESNREIRRGEKPALVGTVANMEQYDIVFVGYPVWWHATPAPVNTFLESYDLTGKLIIPFCTSGESDIDETMPTFLHSCKGLAVYGARRIGAVEQVEGWLSELGLTGERISGAGEEMQVGSGEKEPVENGRKILIAYFSWSSSGNTQKMAAYIQEQIGGDLLELKPQNPYPEDYSECGDVALIERDENMRPEIANLPDSIEEYDTIFIGYPIWWHTAPMIIGTFLENYALTGVDIYPFTQSASMDVGQFENSMEFVKENAVGANVYDGLFAEASDTEAILAYLEENGFFLPTQPLALENEEELNRVPYEYEIRELSAKRGENQIYGQLFLPKAAGEKLPTVIFSHGFGGNYQVGVPYAAALAMEGYAVYCFDFCGGSPGSKSDGSTLEMSIFTEQEDLEAVIRMMQQQDFVDAENIFLMGTSQGGAVSAITAAAHKEEIRGAILLYPAFVLVDNIKAQFERAEDIPDSYYLMWMTVGRAYAEKLLDYDIYEAISGYDRDVLLLHGDADSIVPLSYSERALEVYESAQLEVFEGAGHGFYGEDAARAIRCITKYLNAHIR